MICAAGFGPKEIANPGNHWLDLPPSQILIRRFVRENQIHVTRLFAGDAGAAGKPNILGPRKPMLRQFVRLNPLAETVQRLVLCPAPSGSVLPEGHEGVNQEVVAGSCGGAGRSCSRVLLHRGMRVAEPHRQSKAGRPSIAVSWQTRVRRQS